MGLGALAGSAGPTGSAVGDGRPRGGRESQKRPDCVRGDGIGPVPGVSQGVLATAGAHQDDGFRVEKGNRGEKGTWGLPGGMAVQGLSCPGRRKKCNDPPPDLTQPRPSVMDHLNPDHKRASSPPAPAPAPSQNHGPGLTNPAALDELTQLILATLTTIAPEVDPASLDPVRAFPRSDRAGLRGLPQFRPDAGKTPGAPDPRRSITLACPASRAAWIT